MADGGGSGDAAGVRRPTPTDPTLDDVLLAAGFDVTEAGRQRWRQQLSVPVPAAALEDAQRLRARARGRAA